MRLEVNQLNSEIKSAGQTIRIKYARRNISQVFYSTVLIDCKQLASWKIRPHEQKNKKLI